MKGKVDFKSKLFSIRENIWSVIVPYLPSDGDEYSKTIWEYPSRRGKYLRPGLVVLSCEMFGGKPEKSHLTAAAMQLSEEWLLVHDDVEDHSEERRSTERERRFTLNRLYGDEIAVNAGDALHIIMWKIIGDAVRGLGKVTGWQVYNKLNDIVLRATKGQFTELSWIKNKQIDITEQEYFGMILEKTAYYTIIGPIQLGAIIAGTDKNKLNQIEAWGKRLGYIFQITDDVLNLTVDSKIYGKEKGGDILEGKRTLMLCHLLRSCSPQEKKKVEGIYAKDRNKKTEAEKRYVISLMENYGSIDYAKSTSEKIFKELMSEFENATIGLPYSEAKEQLIECMYFIKDRKR